MYGQLVVHLYVKLDFVLKEDPLHNAIPEPRPLSATPGGQLPLDDVVGRDQDIARLWAMLATSSVRLNEPRRLGKTSVLNKLAAEPPPDWLCVKVSLQGVNSTTEMAESLLARVYQLQRLPKRALRALKSVMAGATATVEGVSFTLAPAFRSAPVAALQAALGEVSEALQERGDRLLLACDEVPDMLLSIAENEGPTAAADVLAVLRRFRDAEADSAVRWLLTGSVGMHHVLRKIGAGDDLVNDLDNFHLGPFDVAWSKWLGESLLLGAGLEYDTDTPAELARITGGIPYLVHLIVAYARDDQEITRMAAGDTDKVFERAVADLDASQQSTHLLTRLAPYYGHGTLAAEWILDRTAESPVTRSGLQAAARTSRFPLPSDAELRDLLVLLSLDHYLTKDPAGAYSWRYPALQRIWKIRRS